MKKRYKNIIIFTIAVLPAFIAVSCSSVSRNHLSVRIPFTDKKAVDFKKPAKILYKDLEIKNQPKGYQILPEIKNFFLKEMAQVTQREIEPFIEENKTEDALLISGKLSFDIKERSVIRKVRNDAGKKAKTFVSVQHWGMEFEVVITGVDGKEVFKKKYESKLKDADPEKPEFNFKALFSKVTDKFIKEVTRNKRFEQRYLLLR
ncbi:MAG: hypothetical protein KAW12_08640 [Candidatus Aminicenantes bacterium]|nr:hypothetical protein [Candidatus Aminicenantes bacterium]